MKKRTNKQIEKVKFACWLSPVEQYTAIKMKVMPASTTMCACERACVCV